MHYETCDHCGQERIVEDYPGLYGEVKPRAMVREEVIELIDEEIIPAKKMGHVVFTNGERYDILVNNGRHVHEVDLTAVAGLGRGFVLTAERYAEIEGLTLPLQTLPAEPEAVMSEVLGKVGY